MNVAFGVVAGLSFLLILLFAGFRLRDLPKTREGATWVLSVEEILQQIFSLVFKIEHSSSADCGRINDPKLGKRERKG